MELKAGMPAISKAGHDKGQWYVVIRVEEPYAMLANGKNRTIDDPKKKKVKHLQPVNEVPEILQEKLLTGKMWTNEEIKRAIKFVKKD